MTTWVGGDDGAKHVLVDPVIGLGNPAINTPIQVIWVGDPNGVKQVAYNRIYPVTLTGTPRGFGTVDLTWNSAGLFMSYKLYKGTDPVPLYDGPLLKATDTAATPGTSITYRVDAIYNGEVVTSDDVVVAVPALPDLGLVVTEVSYTWLQLDWTVSAATYILYRDGAQIWTGTGSTYKDTTLAPDTSYVYTLKVVQAGAPLNPGDTATAVTLALAVPDLTLTAPQWDRVVISWTPAVPGWTHKLFRTGNPTPLYTGPGTTFTDLGRLPGTSYEYTVVSYYASGAEANRSLPESITTPARVAMTLTVTAPYWDQTVLTVTDTNTGAVTYKFMSGTTTLQNTASKTYTHNGRVPETLYSYTVQPFVGTTAVGPVVSGSATTPARVVPVIKITSGSYDSMLVEWTDVDQRSVDWYELWRETNGVGNWAIVESEPASDKAAGVGAAENTWYRYLVRSFRGGKPSAGGVQVGGDALATGRTRERLWGEAQSGPAPGYGSYGTTSTKVINVEGNQVNLPYNCRVYTVKQWVWGYGGNGRVEPKFGGVSLSINHIVGPGQGWRDFGCDIEFTRGVKTSGMRLGGVDWGSSQWTGWVAQQNYIMPGIYPAGSSTGYIATWGCYYWYYPDAQTHLKSVPWWDDSLEDRVTHTATWTDEETGEITRALITDHETGEVLVEWEAGTDA